MKSADFRRGNIVIVNDRMQSGYHYVLTAVPGEDFDPVFKSDLTPAEMLELVCSAAHT